MNPIRPVKRMTLSDRFAQIRSEAIQKQTANLNPGGRSGLLARNFGESFSRADRPMAVLEVASKENRWLAEAMSQQQSIMSEVYSRNFAPLHPAPRAPFRGAVGKAKLPIARRIGGFPGGFGQRAKPKGSVYSRLGKKPMHQRLGPRIQSIPRVANRSRFAAPAGQNNRRPQGKRPGNRKPANLTAEQLDNDLDSYMSNQMDL